MARHEEDDVVEGMTMVAHNGLLARYAEHKLGLAIVTPEEPDDPEERPGACLQCGERAIEWGADCLTLELAAQHMLPKAHPYEPDDDTAGLPVHFRCWDAFRAGREVTVLITEETEHGQVDYILNDEILALMAQDPTQAFAHLVDATADARDTDDDRSITREEVCALVVAIFKIHGVPVPPKVTR